MVGCWWAAAGSVGFGGGWWWLSGLRLGCGGLGGGWVLGRLRLVVNYWWCIIGGVMVGSDTMLKGMVKIMEGILSQL